MRRLKLRTGNEGWLTSYADLITNLIVFFILIISASEIQKSKLEAISEAITHHVSPDSLSEAKKNIEASIAKENLKSLVDVEMRDDGLVMAFNSGVMFASGAARVLPDMEIPLERVLQLLAPYREKYRYAIEGHTDEVPIARNADFKSNWDLAAGRALEVRERLEKTGIPRDRMRVEAYADTRPLGADQIKGLSREEILAKHRRVIIRLY